VSHAHIDHIGGAKFLQDTYGTRIAMPAADWDFTEKSTRAASHDQALKQPVFRCASFAQPNFA